LHEVWRKTRGRFLSCRTSFLAVNCPLTGAPMQAYKCCQAENGQFGAWCDAIRSL